MKQLGPIVAEAGQSSFYVPGLAAPALVTVNGIILQPGDFTIEGETITFAAPIGVGNEMGAIIF